MFYTSYAVLISFFFSDTATTEIYTVLTHSFPTRRSSYLRLKIFTTNNHYEWSKLPVEPGMQSVDVVVVLRDDRARSGLEMVDRKSTRLNQSLMRRSYAVFCLKKKRTPKEYIHTHNETYDHM